MYVASYTKPDGRCLWLYSRTPIAPIADVPSPSRTPVEVATHLRWHPLLQEWVVYAGHRQDRTFMPTAADNPLAPTANPARPTELPAGDYEIAVFDNRFPSLSFHPGPPPEIPGVETAPALGRCEVVVFSQQADTSLSRLSPERLALILQVLAARTRAMADAGIAYVLPFENRGVEMGVTLQHPHGQIYGYGALPRHQHRVLLALQAYYAERSSDLVSDMAVAERENGARVIAARAQAVAFAPPFARFPYECWIVPTQQSAYLWELSDTQRDDMAAVLSDVLRRLDALWARPMPYLLTVNQAPTDGEAHPEWSVRIEVWPIRRAENKLKFLAGTELGAGIFVNDISPEAAAETLRNVVLT